MGDDVKVLITGKLPDSVIERVRKIHAVTSHDAELPMTRDQIRKAIVEQDGLLCMITDKVDADLLDHAPKLKMIANYGVGYDHIDVSAVSGRGIPVSNTPGVLTNATADLAMALILGMGRRIVAGDAKTRRGDFKFWSPMHFLGREITGKTLGLIGLGRIGKAVARRAAGFDMRVVYYSRHRLSPEDEERWGVSHRSLADLLGMADYVSLHVPLSGGTRHLIGERELKRMKSSAFLINTSRGPVVDEKALVAALKAGRIAGAGLDVYEKEPELAPGLADIQNCILLPHVGSATIETRTRMAELAVDNLLAGLAGERPPDCLNWDQVADRGNR
ncbi:MAG: D-glycerate dehydrogenase [Deltaproteobacteria bacterium]|nr:MAG: D-glycerate dehydrogenase [Deltaproteobacteria bacterium]